MATATERKPLTWVTQSRDFHRSACGRFDVVTTPAAGAWIAYDFEKPKRREFATLEAAKDWCQRRAEGK